MTTICNINNICLNLDGHSVLDNLSAGLPSGISGLVAPNGRGKSVLLKLLSGHWRPDGGGIEWRTANTARSCRSVHAPGALSVTG